MSPAMVRLGVRRVWPGTNECVLIALRPARALSGTGTSRSRHHCFTLASMTRSAATPMWPATRRSPLDAFVPHCDLITKHNGVVKIVGILSDDTSSDQANQCLLWRSAQC